MGSAISSGLDRQTRSFINYAMRLPTLALEDERQLIRRALEKDDRAARERLINAHLKLVISQALRLRHYGIALADLIQEGSIGLAKALERFDSSHKVRFSTYAAWWVRAAMQDFILRNWSIVRMGSTSTEKRLFFNLRRLRAKLEQATGSFDSAGLTAALAGRLGIPEVQVAAYDQRLTNRDCSINEPVGDESPREMQDMLVDDRAGPDELAAEKSESADRHHRLRRALAGLSDRERDIIRRRHLTDEPQTLEGLGALHGVSKERIRQIECRALTRLRQDLAP
ncbi:MAG: RNA polymerase factor sigma-32 [Dongiaceae bacterium]